MERDGPKLAERQVKAGDLVLQEGRDKKIIKNCPRIGGQSAAKRGRGTTGVSNIQYDSQRSPRDAGALAGAAKKYEDKDAPDLYSHGKELRGRVTWKTTRNPTHHPSEEKERGSREESQTSKEGKDHLENLDESKGVDKGTRDDRTTRGAEKDKESVGTHGPGLAGARDRRKQWDSQMEGASPSDTLETARVIHSGESTEAGGFAMRIPRPGPDLTTSGQQAHVEVLKRRRGTNMGGPPGSTLRSPREGEQRRSVLGPSEVAEADHGTGSDRSAGYRKRSNNPKSTNDPGSGRTKLKTSDPVRLSRTARQEKSTEREKRRTNWLEDGPVCEPCSEDATEPSLKTSRRARRPGPSSKGDSQEEPRKAEPGQNRTLHRTSEDSNSEKEAGARMLSGYEEDQRVIGFDDKESEGVLVKTYERWRSLLGEEKTPDSRAEADRRYKMIKKTK
jgi:hypothetical protein